DGTGAVPLTGGGKPLVWLAYPGDAAPTPDLSQGYLSIYGGNDNVYFDGFHVTPLTNYSRKGISPDPRKNATTRRCNFANLPTGGIGGSNNQSAIMFTDSHGPLGNYYAVSDNSFDDLAYYAIIAYTSNKVLFESNTVTNVTGSAPVVGPKANSKMWFIRA